MEAPKQQDAARINIPVTLNSNKSVRLNEYELMLNALTKYSSFATDVFKNNMSNHPNGKLESLIAKMSGEKSKNSISFLADEKDMEILKTALRFINHENMKPFWTKIIFDGLKKLHKAQDAKKEDYNI